MHTRLLVTGLLLTTALAYAGGLPEWKAVAVAGSQDEFQGCSLGCLVDWKLSASSQLKPQGGNHYTAQQAQDGRLNTCWAEGAKTDGVGEWLEFRIGEIHGERASIDGFLLANGYQKSADSFRDNGRIAELWLERNGEPQAVLALLDQNGLQRVRFPAVSIAPGDRIRLRITRVYPGARYPDACLAEILPEGPHGH